MLEVAQSALVRIRTDLFTKMQKLPVRFYDTNSNGDLMSRFTNDVDTIEVTYLNGKRTPTLESRVSRDTLGIEYRMYHDFGINIIDWRGMSYNPGK